MLILGIESSCDETAAAVVADGHRVMSDVGGVCMASERAHSTCAGACTSRAVLQPGAPCRLDAVRSGVLKKSPEAPPAHTRRPRYPGRHPRRFEEKYKELAPDRYPSEVQKVLAAGKTPAGTHRPIMVAEVLACLRPAAGEVEAGCSTIPARPTASGERVTVTATALAGASVRGEVAMLELGAATPAPAVSAVGAVRLIAKYVAAAPTATSITAATMTMAGRS